jgi:hypothetical protein
MLRHTPPSVACWPTYSALHSGVAATGLLALGASWKECRGAAASTMLVKLAATTAAATRRAWKKPGIRRADGRENRETTINGAKRASKVGREDGKTNVVTVNGQRLREKMAKRMW